VSEKRNIVIIGCGAGGATAAQFARKTDRKASITIYEQGPYPEYSKCGLPYAISKDIPHFEDLIEFSEEWFKKAQISLHLNTIVTGIDTNKQQITVKNQNDESFTQSYTSLIIATGAKPAIPPIQNITTEHDSFVDGVFTLRTIDDAKEIAKHAQQNKRATVVGAGLIGLEMADCLHRKKMKVTVVEALPNILQNTLDADMTSRIFEKLSEKITTHTNHFATEIKTKQNNISEVIIQEKETKNTQNINTDLLIIATGTKPVTDIAEQAGCDIGETKGIKVDDTSLTSKKNIYAVGDCTEYKDYVTGKPFLVGLGSIAVRQGIAAGTNAAGGSYVLPKGALLTCTSDIFGIEIASVGPAACFLEKKSIVSGKHHGSSLPPYFPGGKPITMKTKVDVSTGAIVSAQAVGENAAQRVNTYAAAILGNLDISTFRTLETAYAPPVAPTLDVVTLAADIAMMKYQRKK